MQEYQDILLGEYPDSRQLRTRNEVEMLGVTYDNKMTFKRHIEHIARKAKAFLAVDGKETVRGSNTLCWNTHPSRGEWGRGGATSHLSLLDKIQERARGIIQEDEPESEPNLPSL